LRKGILEFNETKKEVQCLFMETVEDKSQYYAAYETLQDLLDDFKHMRKYSKDICAGKHCVDHQRLECACQETGYMLKICLKKERASEFKLVPKGKTLQILDEEEWKDVSTFVQSL